MAAVNETGGTRVFVHPNGAVIRYDNVQAGATVHVPYGYVEATLDEWEPRTRVLGANMVTS